MTTEEQRIVREVVEVPMKIKLRNNYPENSTRFLLPTIALRGFRNNPRELTLAWWTWRLVIFWHNAKADS